MIQIAFANVTLGFEGRNVFSHFSAAFDSGKIFAVTGRNGSGKSTLLRLAAKLVAPDEGGVVASLDGAEMKGENYRRMIGMLTPEMRFYPRLTAAENLRFFLGLRGENLSAASVRSLLTRVGLSESETQGVLVGGFSTGMAQRLKIAALIASGAKIWLLDEPGLSLDDDGAAMLTNELTAARKEGKLILLATNDRREKAAADETTEL